MVEYNKVNARLSDVQRNKLKTVVKNKQSLTLRMNIKMFNGNSLPHELLLTTKQKSKLRNAFENNMSTYMKLSRAQISKIIQSGGFLGALMSKLEGPLMKVAVPLTKYFNSIRNNSCCFFKISSSNSKENTWFWNNNFNNFE